MDKTPNELLKEALKAYIDAYCKKYGRYPDYEIFNTPYELLTHGVIIDMQHYTISDIIADVDGIDNSWISDVT